MERHFIPLLSDKYNGIQRWSIQCNNDNMQSIDSIHRQILTLLYVDFLTMLGKYILLILNIYGITGNLNHQYKLENVLYV